MGKQHRESPIKRVNPSGKVVWVARYTGPDGKRRSAGTFSLKRQARDAINDAYETPASAETVGAYLERWIARHPRSDRTNRTNEHRISRVLGVKLEGCELRHWLLRDLHRRHANDLVDHMLCKQGRAATGAVNILRALSAMCEDAITDELCELNPFKGVRVRASDPRAAKQSRPPRVWSWEQMHAFAAAAGRWEPMLRTLADCGLRIGELFALERSGVEFEAATLTVSGSAWNGRVVGSSREKRHDRIVPIPPGCRAQLKATPVQLHSLWLFPTPTGRLWRYDNWRRDVWVPTVERAGIDPTPQEFRHSWNTHLRAAGVDPADLAEMAGHSVETATARYTHPLRRSFEQVRTLVG